MINATNPSISSNDLAPPSDDLDQTAGTNTGAATSTQSQGNSSPSDESISMQAYNANFSTTRDPSSADSNRLVMINPSSVNPKATQANIQGQMDTKLITESSDNDASTSALGKSATTNPLSDGGVTSGTRDGQLVAVKPKDVISAIRATFEAASTRIAGRGLTRHIIENHIEDVGKSLFKDVASAKGAIRETLDSGVNALNNLTTAQINKLANEGKLVLKEQGLRIYKSIDDKGVSMVIEKKLADEVGTKGEKVVRVVTDVALGTIITAFPVFAFSNMSSAQNANVNDSFTKSVTSAIRTINAMPTPNGGKHGWIADVIGFLDPTGILSADRTVSGPQEARGLLLVKALASAEKAAGRSFSASERALFQQRWLNAVMIGIEDRNR